jgi:outer membrane lipoprotein SlyB
MTGGDSRSTGIVSATRGGLMIVALAVTLLGPFSASPVRAQANVVQTIRYGTVVSVTEAVVQVQGTNTGATVGATAGAVAGYALADSSDRWLGGLLGGVLGGAAGKSIEKAAKKKKGWELIIKVDGGQEISIGIPGKKQGFHEGDRVRMTGAAGGQTKVTHHKG